MGDLLKHDFLTVEPNRVVMAHGSEGYWTLHNHSVAKLAIKFKCTNTSMYRLRPVFAILESGANCAIEVHCKANDNSCVTAIDDVPTKPKKERLVINYIGMLTEETSAEEVYKHCGGAMTPNVRIVLELGAQCNGLREMPPNGASAWEGAKHSTDAN